MRNVTGNLASHFCKTEHILAVILTFLPLFWNICVKSRTLHTRQPAFSSKSLHFPYHFQNTVTQFLVYLHNLSSSIGHCERIWVLVFALKLTMNRERNSRGPLSSAFVRQETEIRWIAGFPAHNVLPTMHQIHWTKSPRLHGNRCSSAQ